METLILKGKRCNWGIDDDVKVGAAVILSFTPDPQYQEKELPDKKGATVGLSMYNGKVEGQLSIALEEGQDYSAVQVGTEIEIVEGSGEKFIVKSSPVAQVPDDWQKISMRATFYPAMDLDT